MDWKSLFFTAEGRIGRQAFWIAWLSLLGVNVVLGWVPFLPLLALFCMVCIYTKRLHDMGQTGWLQLIPLVFGPVLLIGSITLLVMGSAFASLGDGDPDIVALFGVGGVILSLITGFLVTVGFTLWVGCSATRPGENRFGAEPMTAVLV